eukprot:CAMPEP_0181087506 /NCGR_PEP_ID=MMETSP1071-20121207/6308_1 /TAXON_ID=35127 /ORGANISM="Thalassiosira sp., Strain NH16" /LENGTH=1240 /DNA_ID=CAMNT_0023169397 /DNA_START=70 /DNA_END=3791 /DNA_ORIENTATION=-
MNENEKKHGTLPVVTAKTKERTVTIVKGKGRKQLKTSYTFDDVFTAFSTQEEVFEATVKPVIVDVMRGFEATVFAYGQTGTGKTHTMEGSLASPDLHGVIPRSARAIFEHLKKPKYRDQVVTCSYLEIYNEELRDLLVDSPHGSGSVSHGGSAGQQYSTKLDIMEGKNGDLLQRLIEKRVHSASDVLTLMQKAQHSRMIGETKMNKSSSRSHCLFTIQVHGKISLRNGDGDMEFNGKLHMVDLAGSECAKSAGNDKGAPDAVARERERMNINRSLLTLGRVITVLKEKSLNKNANIRIPYRDSKLTRVLQEALGGRCKTVIVATISPSITAIEESVSTLNYAHSANGIVNKPVSSSLISFGDNISGMGSGNDNSDSKSPAPSIESWQEMEMRLQYMQAQVDEAQAALARKHIQQQELQDRAEKAESELLTTQEELYNANKEIKSLHEVVEVETGKRKLAEKELHDNRVQLKKTELILSATQATESSLTLEAQSLIGKLEDIISERNDMHALVVSQRGRELERQKATVHFQDAALAVLNNIESSFSDLSNSIDTGQSSAIKVATLNHEVGRHSVSETGKLISDIAKNVQCVMNSMKVQLAGEDGIAPTVESSTNSAMSLMKEASATFVGGEHSFDESRESMRRRLDECTKILDQRASSIQTSTTKSLQSFESSVVESKNAISSLITRIKSSLSDLSEAKAEKAKTLDCLVEQWRDESLANSKAILDVTTSSSTSLMNSIDEFQRGMRNHKELKVSLHNQRSFLDSTGSTHVQTVNEQGTLLNAHRKKVAESHDTQTKLRNEVMQSIMSGVQTLVSSEIEKLASTQMNHFKVLDQDSANLASANDRITESAKQVMENMQSTNQLLSNKASTVWNNDLKAGEAMKSTQSTLEEVMATSNTHTLMTDDFASRGITTVSEMKKLDNQNSEVMEMVDQDGQACSTSLINNVFKPTSADMKKTMQSSLKAMSYVTGKVVPNANGDLERIAESRKTIATQMSDSFGSASAQLSDLAGRVTSMATTQHDAADKLANETLALSNVHTSESVPYYYAELDSGKDKLMDTMTKLSETSTRVISEGKAQGFSVKQSVEDFARVKMQCAKPVDPVPMTKECRFSHSLSSTPADDVILEGADFNISLSEDRPLSCVTAGAATSKPESPVHPDADTSHESHDDDDASRKSSGSLSSLPSPRLKCRDINVQNGGKSSIAKPRKHRRANNTPSVNGTKCPSGPLTQSSKHGRKRLKRV